MNFMELLKRMEHFCCKYDLQDVDVTSNKINGVCCLIFKHKGKIFDVIVLKDERFTTLAKSTVMSD